MHLEPIIAVDFDGTIAENDYPNVGEELPGAIEGLKELQEAGCQLILWTCRHADNLEVAVDWLAERGVTMDAVNDHSRHDLIPGQSDKRKVYANLYLDDKSFPAFPGWPVFMEWFRKQA